jgi:hypothetical protein
MATTGGTAPPAPLTIPPPVIEPLSDDDGSSPLSDLGGSQNDLDQLESPAHVHNDVDSDDDVDNDTEAETERLYPTPQNPTRHKDALRDGPALERTPTKLRQGIAVDDDDEPLSELHGSFASSPPGAQSCNTPTVEKLPSPTLDILAEAAANQDPDSRKRKRASLPPGQADAETGQPARKRSGSAAPSGRRDRDGDVTMGDDEGPSTNTTSGDEAVVVPAVEEEHDEHTDDAGAEAQIEAESRSRKQTRSGSKKNKASRTESAESPEEAADGTTAEEDGVHTGDENAERDVDEEAEAAQRNEEERTRRPALPNTVAELTGVTVERKKAAFEQLTSIEKRFATFRDRYVYAHPPSPPTLPALTDIVTIGSTRRGSSN